MRMINSILIDWLIWLNYNNIYININKNHVYIYIYVAYLLSRKLIIYVCATGQCTFFVLMLSLVLFFFFHELWYIILSEIERRGFGIDKNQSIDI
jgi:hypothetical protein